MTLLEGIDVSKWQPTTPRLNGLSFAFARATYATTPDPKYAMHTANFRKAGLVVGAYHFGVGFKPVHEQVRAFLSIAKGADLLVLDLERDTTKTMTKAEAREFIALVHATGKKIGLYGSRSGFPSLGQDYNWVAQWRDTPPTGIEWAFWQYQGSPLDRDKFNGTKAQLLALAGRAPTPPKEDLGGRGAAASKPEAVEDDVIVVTIEKFPFPRTFTSSGPQLRRFTASEELAPIEGAYTATVDATVAIESKGVPHGTGFLRLASGGSVGKYILTAQVELA